MTHTAAMPDSAGDFSEFKPVDDHCPKNCAVPDVRYRVWESNCGGYEDLQYRCFGCGHRWWIDGVDS